MALWIGLFKSQELDLIGRLGGKLSIVENCFDVRDDIGHGSSAQHTTR